MPKVLEPVSGWVATVLTAREEGLHYIREVILILWLITVHSYYKSKEKKKIPPGCFCDYRK